jgi:hypothetical protein
MGRALVSSKFEFRLGSLVPLPPCCRPQAVLGAVLMRPMNYTHFLGYPATFSQTCN